MPTVRVFQTASGIRVVNTESDEAFEEQIAITVANDPELQNVPYVDIDSEDLPDRETRYQWRIENGVLVVDTAIQPPASVVERTAAFDDLQAQYQSMMDRLDQIIAASSPTNAQVIAAVKDLATHQRKMLRFLKAEYTEAS